ncbi:MAG: pilin [Patescibacteria group bacterium]|jgi:hypothetical protein
MPRSLTVVTKSLVLAGFIFLITVATPNTALANVDCKSSGGQCVPGDTLPVYCPPGMNQFTQGDCSKIGSHPYVACCRGTAETGTSDVTGTKVQPKPGLGAVPCGAGQLYEDGNLSFTDCLSKEDCFANRGRITGETNKAGCPEDQPLFCCIMKKNRCNDSSRLPTKIYLCTTASQCTANSGAVFAGGPSGCGTAYPICCEFNDSPDNKTPMLNLGEPLQGLSGATGGRTAAVSRVARKYQNINSFCYTEVDCAKSSAAGAWVKGNGCPNKGNTPQGYCKAPPPQYDLQYPIGGVKTISDLKNFIGLIFNYAMGIIMIVAAVIFVYGGLRYMFAAISDDVQVGKTIMVDSVIGLLLGLGAYAIMANVNFNTVNLRSFDVFMINKLSFYDALYCKDVLPAAGKDEVKLQEAGTPFAPENFDITKGYPLVLKDTECGHEYFIEGGDSLSVCTGSGCGGKGLCLNCSGDAKNCRSSSEKEHVCFDANIGGNVILSYPALAKYEGKWANQFIKAYAFCITNDANMSGRDFTEVGRSENMVDKPKSSGLTGGAVTPYAIKINLSKIEEIKNNCSGKSGLILEHHLDTDWKFANAGFSVDAYYYVNKNCSFTNATQEIFERASNWTIDSTIDKMYNATPGKVNPNYDWTFNGAWSLDEILKTKDSPINCSINMGSPDTKQGFWHTWTSDL